jgi:hypothetical protein
VGPFTYQWHTGNAEIDPVSNPTAATAVLSLTNIRAADVSGYYFCVVTNSCGSVNSNAATLSICGADFNCDAAVDFFDYLDFVNAFSESLTSADFNADGTIDFFDYLDFVDAFSNGC